MGGLHRWLRVQQKKQKLRTLGDKIAMRQDAIDRLVDDLITIKAEYAEIYNELVKGGFMSRGKKYKKFFEENEFAVVPGLEDQEEPIKFLWDNYTDPKIRKKMGELMETHDTYTVVTDDKNDFWIVDGYHYVNRVGYMLGKRKDGKVNKDPLDLRW